MKLSLSPRLALLLIAAMFLFPLLLAWMMYSGSLDFKPGFTRNRGTLVEPPVPVDWTIATLAQIKTNGASESLSANNELERHWVILKAIPTDCNQPCLKKAAELRQVHLALGHKQTRIRLALLLENSSPPEQAQNLLAIYPQFRLIKDSSNGLPETLLEIQRRPSDQSEIFDGVFMIDPPGNIMMYYQAGGDPNDIKKDLKRLLN